jgi:hypothetical protein
MRHIKAIPLATAVLCGASGCLGLLPKAPPKDSDRQLSEQDRREIRLWGGEELLTDVEQLMATAPKGDPIFECMTDYMSAAKYEKEKGDKKSDQQVMQLNAQCDQRCAQSSGGAYASTANKYAGRCKDKAAVAGKAFYLSQAKLAMEALRKCESPLEWYQGASGVKTELQRDKEGLGSDNHDLDDMNAEYDRLVLAHRREIDKARSFLDRDDILDLQQQAHVLDEELNMLHRRYNDYHLDSTLDLIRVEQARRDALDERYRREGMKAGVLKDKRP